jgi:NAD(P)H-quinone oxidoreductase subunit 4L
MVPIEFVLILGAIVFVIGTYGALVKRNAVAILMSIELMLNAVNITFIAFAKFTTPTLITGQIFAIFVLAVAAAEAAVGLAIVLTIYRARKTVDATDVNLMKW